MRHISRSELKRIMATPMEDEKVELARRMFIFSSLTGLAYADLRNLYPCHLGKRQKADSISVNSGKNKCRGVYSSTPGGTKDIVII